MWRWTLSPRRRRRRSGSRKGGWRSGSGGPSDSKPAALRRSSVEGSKSKASEDASQSVPRSVSSSSSSELGSDSPSDRDYTSDFLADSDYCDSDVEPPAFELVGRDKEVAAMAKSMPGRGLMLLLFEAPSGFALFTFYGVYCYLPETVDEIWAEFGDNLRPNWMLFFKGYLSFEDKSSAINPDTGVDKRLVDLINKWHDPGVNVCVGKPEYKRIIETVLKIPCMYSQTVMEIMWGIQQQLPLLVPEEKSKLTKEDRLPISQGLMKFLSNYGFDVKPEMVNEKIFTTACALFHLDSRDKKNLGILLDAGLHIRDNSDIACEDWDILKLAIAVKVICCPEEELTDLHEVLTEDVVSKLKGDAHKYTNGSFKNLWLRTYNGVVSNHHLRIAKKKLLGSLVRKAKKAYESEQVEAKRSPRPIRKHSGDDKHAPHKRSKY